jgi:hypothetical protein
VDDEADDEADDEVDDEVDDDDGDDDDIGRAWHGDGAGEAGSLTAATAGGARVR